MIGLDVRLNGHPVCLASVGEAGALTAVVSSVVSSGEDTSSGKSEHISLHVGGRAGRHTYTWNTDHGLKVGDVVEVRIVNIESADDAIKAASAKADPEGIPGWFDEARAKHRKGGG